MKMKRVCLLLSILIMGPLVFSSEFDPADFAVDYSKINEQTGNLGMKIEAHKEYMRADETLNALYSKILKLYKGNPNFVSHFRQAQRAWMKYRDLHIKSIFPFEDGDGARYAGSGYSYALSLELAEITWIRVRLIYKWLDGDGMMGSYGVYSE